jgi:hypothetical protein
MCGDVRISGGLFRGYLLTITNSEFNMRPGSILLYSPFATFKWCLLNKRKPSLKTVFDCLCGLAILVVCQSQYTHVVQCIDEDRFVHTRVGKVRLDRKRDFAPGYLETARAIHLVGPVTKDIFTEQVKQAFLSTVGRWNIDPLTIPLAAPFRWLYKLGCVRRDVRSSYRYVNCVTFVAKTWKQAGVDIFQLANTNNTKHQKSKVLDTCWVGLYPSDLLLCARE